LKAACLGLGDVAFLAICPVQRGEIARDTGVDLLHPLGDLGDREVLVAIVDRLELAAVDGDDGLGEQVQATAQRDELAACRRDRWTIGAAEIRNGLEVRRQPAGQPNQLEIASGLALQPPT
jgi:hypothetical protein